MVAPPFHSSRTWAQLIEPDTPASMTSVATNRVKGRPAAFSRGQASR